MKKIAIILLLIFLSIGFSADTTTYKTTPSSIKFAGELNSPVEVMMFVSSSCPSCKKAAVLFYELANSAYKGKMKLSIKPIYKQLGDIALIAADNQNRSWELVKVYSNTSKRIDAEIINDLFTQAGIDKEKIYEDMRDSIRIYSILEANYAESKKCGMTFTPHILINNKIYDGEVNPQSVTDYIDKLLMKK